jgi:hypothetical protein
MLGSYFNRFNGGNTLAMLTIISPERNADLVVWLGPKSLAKQLSRAFELEGSARGQAILKAVMQDKDTPHRLADGVAQAVVGDVHTIAARRSCKEAWLDIEALRDIARCEGNIDFLGFFFFVFFNVVCILFLKTNESLSIARVRPIPFNNSTALYFLC